MDESFLNLTKQFKYDESFEQDESVKQNEINTNTVFAPVNAPVNVTQTAQQKQQPAPAPQVKEEEIRPYKKGYPAAFGAADFELHDGHSIKELADERNRMDLELKYDHSIVAGDMKYEKDILWSEKKFTYAEQVKRKASRFDAEVAILYRNKRFKRDDKPEMEYVKKCAVALSNFLSKGDLSEMRVGRQIDPEAFMTKVNLAYQTTIDACDDYLNHRNPSRWFGKGMQRYQMVQRLKTRCETELAEYKNAKQAIIQNAIIKESSELNCPREVLENIRSTTIKGPVIWQNHGNSTDVYRVVLVMGDSNEEKTYYMKDNILLLSADLPAFVERRTNQLQASFDNKGTVNEEQRLVENQVDETDYKNGLTFFNKMKSSLKGASGRVKTEMMKRYVEFFGHDFDAMFKEFSDYNTIVSSNDAIRVDKLLEEWQAKLKKDKKNVMAETIIKNLQDIKAGKPPEVMTAAEWVKERINSGKMGLDSKMDADLIKILLGMQEKKGVGLKKDGSGRIETFFRITCGKEVELYGQMKARGNIMDNDISAMNNIATDLLATECGFGDLICSSFSSMTEYTKRDGTTGPTFVTFSEAAEGEELIDLQHRAARENKKLMLSSHAVLQLQELYSLDLVCLQVDRHGRNFKCLSEPAEDGNIVITSIKAYDNDMSFTEEALDTVFQSDDKKSTKKAGFLPPLFKTVKSDSVEYAHIAKNYFGVDICRKLKVPDKVVVPDADGGVIELTDKEKDKFLAVPLVRSIGFSGGVLKDRRTGKELKRSYEHTDKEDTSKDPYFLINSLQSTKDDLAEVLCKEDVFNHDYEKEEWLLDKVLKKVDELTPGEKQKLGGLIYLLQRFYENVDATGLRLDPAYDRMIDRWDSFKRLGEKMRDDKAGANEAWISSILYYLSQAYGKDADVIEGYERKKLESIGQDVKQFAIKEGENKPGEAGDLYVPTMLHFSKKAYQNLLTMRDKLNGGDPDLVIKLANVNITDAVQGKMKRSKLAALKLRVEQQIQQLEEAASKAQIFYKAKGYKGVHAKFFLDEEEAKEIDDLGEFTWNAGETYLAIDNDEYLAGQENFEQLMTKADKEQWLASRNKRLTDMKRHKSDAVKDLSNPQSNKIETGKKPADAKAPAL